MYQGGLRNMSTLRELVKNIIDKRVAILRIGENNTEPSLQVIQSNQDQNIDSDRLNNQVRPSSTQANYTFEIVFDNVNQDNSHES
jgi:hypothetical protein